MHGRLVFFSLIAIFGIVFVSRIQAQDSIAVEATSETVAVTETVTAVTETIEAAAPDNLADLAASLDTVWMLLAAMLVFFMQPGFALVEAGFTRTKNTANILMKNCLDFMLGSLLFFFVGFGIMFGCEGAGFMGMPNFFDLSFFDMGLPIEGFLVFQTVFCATAATIVSGAMAERTKFSMYLAYTILISVIIYPISGHWTWGGGWLMNGNEGSFMIDNIGATFHDFAGSTIVHSVGGWVALMGAWVIGPRIGKYSKDGKSKAIPGHNLTIACLGVFILWFGWFGFNPGSQLAASGESKIAISHVFLTTNLAACAGGFFALLTAWFKYKKPSLSLTLNGVLAGLVGITAGCDAVSPVGAIIVGTFCGILMVFSVEFIDRILKIDDPVGASSVHGVCGFAGTLLTGLLATEGGLFYGGGASLFLAQLTGALVVGAWALVAGFLIFKGLDVIFGLRVEKRVEEEGLDIYEHGEAAYN
ncbi:MAG: ammonium transporter [Dysgonamonadaceae bacterium]|nr:ammonium transporter [Dysgonamonadaceae bacterium]